MPNEQTTVDVQWLFDNLERDDVVIIDGSWHLPPLKRDPKKDYETGHIQGARFFDLDKHSDPNSCLSHMMPSAEQFSREMGELGISNKHTIVVYDTVGLFSAARIWWMFRYFGVSTVYVLDGGLPAWQEAGYPLEKGTPSFQPVEFATTPPMLELVDLTDVKAALATPGNPLILDARSADRFYGRAAEPRADVKSGHMPGAVNLPYKDLLDKNGKLLADEALQSVFDKVRYHANQPVITSCGSGVTACIILLALTKLGYTNMRLYDGSWSEWGTQADTPIETEA